MEWLIGAVVFFIIYYKFLVKRGSLEFWKLIQATEQNRNSAYHLFTSSSAWHVSDNNSSVKAPADIKNWMGPFRFRAPDGRLLTMYGKVGEYEKTIEEFMKRN
ncbi:MAG: hypothetical protein QF443_05055 [Dehalococcoidia bacterium]|jgi:hypothetical protein|nr:hypothetical protein [Dehalococcoidia bacterium]|tara:strand:+ start:1194 stop:1502 length:309 start_codon:yes stop_codon:yes gene_type:complete